MEVRKAEGFPDYARGKGIAPVGRTRGGGSRGGEAVRLMAAKGEVKE